MVAPAGVFLTVHPGASGLVGELTHAANGRPSPAPRPPSHSTAPAARSTCACRTSAWNPTGKVVRLAAGVGLWDNANDRYLLPQQTADATHPGGSGEATAPAAFFNVAFRFDEPMPAVTDPAGDGAEPRVVA